MILRFYNLGATDMWQPINAGIGPLLKQKTRQVSDEWLENEDNMNLWVGKAHERLQHNSYKGFLRHCFEGNGCLMTAGKTQFLKYHLSIRILWVYILNWKMKG